MPGLLSRAGDPPNHLDVEIPNLLAQRIAIQPQHGGRLDLVAPGRGQRQLYQRPLHFGQHLVVDAGRRHAVAMGGEELADMPLDGPRQRLLHRAGSW